MTLRRVSIIALAMLVLLSACATKPPAAPQPEPEPQVVQPEPVQAPPAAEISRDELEALNARVVALRKDAFDLGLKDSMADEYAAADARYIAGKTALDADDRPTAKTELTAAEPLFADLVSKGGLAVANSRKTDAGAARDRALAANAESSSPDALRTSDAMLAAADALLAAGDSRGAIAAYTKAIAAYDATEKRSSAIKVRDRVDELIFGPLDSGNYALAGQKLDSVDGLMATNTLDAQDAAAESLLRYRLVLSKGWELTAGKRRDGAERYKTDAENIKAQVAVKAAYAEAKATWDMAIAAAAAGDNEAASPLFEKAEALFKVVYQEAADKRAAAEAAIQAANAKTAQSEGVAQQGDEQLGTTPDTTGTKE